MQLDNRYDYSSAGFSPFLTRSIDDVGQDALSSDPYVQTRQMAYDRTQVSGMMGDAYRMRNILFDGREGRASYSSDDGVYLLEGELSDRNRGIRIQEPSGLGLAQFGIFSDGRVALKVAKPGFDVATAGPGDLIFDSNNNLFRIIEAKTSAAPAVTTSSDGTDTNSGSATAFYSHGLDFTPFIIAFVEVSPSQYALMPYSEVVSASAPQGGIISNIYRVTANRTNVEIFHYVVSYSPGVGTGTYPAANVKYFLLQETAG